MKPNKIIVAADDNYLNYFYIIADFYNKYLDIDVVLIYFGEKDVICNNRNKVLKYNFKIKKYYIPWAIFYGATLFPDDVVMTSGIDQIPLSNMFFEKIKNYSSEKMIIGLSDCYAGYAKNTLGYFNTKTNILYPSSHIVGKGKNFKKIFKIEEDLSKEFSNLFSSKDNFYFNNYRFKEEIFWGLDECYMSYLISIYDDKDIFVYLKNSRKWFLENRIETNQDILSFSNKNKYSEITLKPYSLFFTPQVQKILKLKGQEMLNENQ